MTAATPAPDDLVWFVCHTKPRCEKKFAALMAAERFEHFWPWLKEQMVGVAQNKLRARFAQHGGAGHADGRFGGAKNEGRGLHHPVRGFKQPAARLPIAGGDGKIEPWILH